jgi:hypothetical protein
MKATSMNRAIPAVIYAPDIPPLSLPSLEKENKFFPEN